MRKALFAMKNIVLFFAIIASSLLSFGQSVHIGDILCTDETIVSREDYPNSGKTAWGIVFYVHNSDSHGWAVALHDQASSIQWCSEYYYGYDIPNLPNYEDARAAMHDLNGSFNTDIIRNVDFASGFPAAWVVDYDNDWYLPSAGQLRYLYSNSPEVNASLQIVGGTTIPYWTNKYYWSSTEFTGYHAYDMNSGGSLGDYVKDNHVNYPPNGIAVRQIRDFDIPNPVHSTYHVGDLITNDDGSQGILFYVNPDQTDGWMVALNDVADYVQWGNNGNVPNLIDQTCAAPYGSLLDETDGFDNTGEIRRFETNSNAANLVDYEYGWYLPTAGQLSKLFGALAFIEDKLQTYGTTLAKDNYWSSSEANADEAFALSCAPTAYIRAGHFLRYGKSKYCRVRAVRNLVFEGSLPIVGNINDPEPICADYSLNLQVPQTQYATSQGWQLSPTPEFNNPIAYNGEPVGLEYDGWYLRYFASNALGTVYSNSVCISVLYSPYVSPIHGESLIHYQTTGDFTYSIDPVEGCYGYDWSLDGPWIITSSPDSPECTVRIYSQGTATLKVRIYTRCGFIERSFLINHDIQPDVIVYPNPTQGNFNIVLYGMKDEAIILIYDYLGQFIGCLNVDTNLEGIVVPYSLTGKAAGIYAITVINHNNVVKRKIVKSTASTYRIYNWDW